MADAAAPKIDAVFKRCIKPGLNRPHDVICHRGHYVVTDTFYNRVMSINPADDSSAVLCEKKQGSLPANMKPYGIMALSDTEQDFLFTDAKNRCILRIQDGDCGKWNQGDFPGEMGRPTGITAHKDGNVYVADSEKHCIHVFDANGLYLRHFGSEHLQFPWFLKFNSHGQLFVTDHNDGIKMFPKNGDFIKKLTVRSENRSWTCRGLTVDRYDNVFVTARTQRGVPLLSKEQVAVFDQNHKVVLTFGGILQFNFARGLCIDYDNNFIVVVDGGWHRLQLYKLYHQLQHQVLEVVNSATTKRLDNATNIAECERSQVSGLVNSVTTKRLENTANTTEHDRSSNRFNYVDREVEYLHNDEDVESGIDDEENVELNSKLFDDVTDDGSCAFGDVAEDEYDWDDSNVKPLEEEYYHIASDGGEAISRSEKAE